MSLKKEKKLEGKNVEEAFKKKIFWDPTSQLASPKPGNLFIFFLQSLSGGGRLVDVVEKGRGSGG